MDKKKELDFYKKDSFGYTVAKWCGSYKYTKSLIEAVNLGYLLPGRKDENSKILKCLVEDFPIQGGIAEKEATGKDIAVCFDAFLTHEPSLIRWDGVASIKEDINHKIESSQENQKIVADMQSCLKHLHNFELKEMAEEIVMIGETLPVQEEASILG